MNATIADFEFAEAWKANLADTANVGNGSVHYGFNADGFEEGAISVNGASAMHFETADNSDAATVIFGSMEVNGALVHDVVVYSSNEDLISSDGTVTKTSVEAEFDTHGQKGVSDFVTISTNLGVKFLVDGEYTSATAFETFINGTSNLDAYVEGYTAGYSEGYVDGYREGYADGVAGVEAKH